jgi:HEPN domain-containing protein
LRQKPAEQVLRESDTIVARRPRPFIEFADHHAFLNRHWGLEFCRPPQVVRVGYNALMGHAARWLAQAQADLEAAKDSLRTSHFEWACFQSQQCAEKALKAVLYARGRTSVISHSLVDLIRECSKFGSEFAALNDAAKHLDGFYIPTRYPNGLISEEPPARYYDAGDAQRCIRFAESILTVCRKYAAH